MATKFLEKNLEDIIFESDADELSERGLEIYGKLYRQFNLGKYGIADLVLYHKCEYDIEKRSSHRADCLVTVFELKRKLIDINALMQAVRYVTGLIFYNKKHYKNYTFQYKIVLIGSEIDSKPEFLYFPELIISNYQNTQLDIDKIVGIEFVKYSYGLDGINFDYPYPYLYNELRQLNKK